VEAFLEAYLLGIQVAYPLAYPASREGNLVEVEHMP